VAAANPNAVSEPGASLLVLLGLGLLCALRRQGAGGWPPGA